MKPRFVAGLFYVSMEVRDQYGPVGTITRTTAYAEHVVTVENISTLPRDIHVFSSLPSGTSHVEFAKTPPIDSWDEQVMCIPSGSLRTAVCPVRRNGAPSAANVPFQLNRLLERLGAAAVWTPIASRAIPFDIFVKAG